MRSDEDLGLLDEGYFGRSYEGRLLWSEEGGGPGRSPERRERLKDMEWDDVRLEWVGGRGGRAERFEDDEEGGGGIEYGRDEE